MTPRIANFSTFASRSTRLSPPSNMRMPHVFVIPPEEEQQDNPPWCCFDANEPSENTDDFPSNPDIHFLDVPYLLQPSEQDAHTAIARISAHQPKPRPAISRKLEKKQRPEVITIIESNSSHARRRDSDVIEVVKVKRSRDILTDLEENSSAKRSKTLRARATKALQSIKNVGKSAHRSHVKELWTSSESMPGIFKGVQEQIRSQLDQTEATLPTKRGSLSRGSARSLVQLFQPPKFSRPEASLPSREALSSATADTHRTLPVASPSPLSHLGCNDTNPSLKEIPNPLMTDDALPRSASPSPPLKKNTKFSVLELHRLFSFSSSSPDDPSSVPTTAAASFSSGGSGSIPSTATSTISSNYPDIPTEEDMLADAQILNFENVDRKLVPRCHQASHAGHDDHLSTPRRLSDLSIEMKLDSLHFDALSFDPEDFDVPVEGNVLR